MFTAIHNMVKEREELRAENNKLRAENNRLKAENNRLKAERNVLEIENKTLAQNFDSARLDYRVSRDQQNTLEQICEIQKVKQVVLWKFIERLQKGQTGPPLDANGYWKEWDHTPMASVSETSEPASERSSSTMGSEESIAKLAPFSEASEPASERSTSTIGSKESTETKLDPHAVRSIPS